MKIKTQFVSLGLAALVIGALSVSNAAGAGNQVTKPYKIKGETVGQITSVSGSTITFDLVNVGEATHCGRYYNVGTTTLSLATLTGTAEGVFTAASGEEVYWVGTISGTTLTVTMTGGTGKYAGGSGGFVAELTNLELDLDSGTITYDFAGRGEVTY